MSTLVIYYSLEGNTDLVAQKIAAVTGADLLRLNPKKEYPSGNVSKFFWGGKSVVFGEKPKLENYDISMEDYDTVIIGTPIWAGTYTPPIKTFLAENKVEGKNIYLFACHSGGATDKCFKKLKEELKKNSIIETADFLNPKENQGNHVDEQIKGFCKRITVEK